MPDDIVIRFSVKDDGSPVIERVNEKLKQTKQETQALAPGIENARHKMTEFVSANAGLIAVATGAAIALKKMYDVAKEGAQLEYTTLKFDRLAESIGTTSDALLSELKDATRGTLSDMEAMALAADLLSLGLAKNSDEAVRLATIQSGLSMDMNQLVLTLTNQTTMRFDALGVSVDGFDEKVNKLKESGMSANEAFKEAFLQQAEAQLEKVGNAADENIGAFKRLEAQMKNNSDTAKMMSSQALAPIADYLADSTAAINKNKEVLQKLNEELYREYSAHKVLTPEMQSLINEYERAVQYGKAWENALKDTSGAMVESAMTTEQLTKANQNLISMVGTFQSAEESYQDKSKDLTEERIKLEEERAAAIAQGWWEGSEKILEYDQKLEENKLKTIENAEEFDLQNKKIMLGYIERQLIADGILDDKETEWLLEKGVSWGVYSQTVVEETRKAIEEANLLTAAINMIPAERTFRMQVLVEGAENVGGLGAGFGAEQWGGGKASGGSVIAGTTYLVGERGPELFSPSTSGTIIPNEKMGNSGDTQKIIEAILSIRPDYNELARAVVSVSQQSSK